MLAADTSSAQALDTESDLFSPRSTAALALSSFAAQAVVEQQQLPPQHHRPAALFGNDAADDDDSGNSSNKPYVVPPSQAEQCQEQRETVVLPRKKPATVISSQEWEKKSAATKKSLASRSTNTAKAEMKKCGNNDRARSSISFPSSLPLQYPDQHHYQTHNYYMQHQQPQYGMVPIQFLPGYAVHHPDFYPPGATALPWTPHSCNDSLSSNNVVFPQRGPSPASSSITSSHGQSPSPPSPLVFHRDPAPSDNTIGGSSPTTIVSINHEPSKRISAVRMSGPSPRILHNRPSPPLHASPPTIGMMPHPHLHNHYNYHHFHRPHSVTWHYPPVSSAEAVCIVTVYCSFFSSQLDISCKYLPFLLTTAPAHLFLRAASPGSARGIARSGMLRYNSIAVTSRKKIWIWCKISIFATARSRRGDWRRKSYVFVCRYANVDRQRTKVSYHIGELRCCAGRGASRCNDLQ